MNIKKNVGNFIKEINEWRKYTKWRKKKAYKVLKEQYENNLNIMKDLEKTFEKKIEES